jgi:hypothetical protein
LLYFHGYVKPSSHPSVFAGAQQPERFFTYFLASLGMPLAIEPWAAVGAGAALLLLYLAALVLVVKGRCQSSVGPTLILFALASSWLLSVGRSGFGFEQALESRYATLSGLGIAGCWLVFADAREWRLAPALLVLMAVGTFLGIHDGVLHGRIRRIRYQELAERLRSFETQSDADLREIFIDPIALRGWARVLRDHRLSVFRDGQLR